MFVLEPYLIAWLIPKNLEEGDVPVIGLFTFASVRRAFRANRTLADSREIDRTNELTRVRSTECEFSIDD